MYFFSILVIALMWAVPSRTFNLGLKGTVVVSDPLASSSYFGYTVALQRNPSRLVVGAPRSASLLLKNIPQPGAVYVCDGRDFQRCQQLEMDRSGEAASTTMRQVFDLKRYAWIGAALDVGDDSNDLVACGPLWRNQHFPAFYLVNGVCYSQVDTRKVNLEAQKLLPLVASEKQGYSLPNRKNESHFYYAYGEAGLSVHLTPFDGNGTKELLIGAPGVLLWTGSVIKYKLNSGRYDEPIIPNPFYSSRDKFSENIYAGYAVSSGVFMSNTRLYVMSAPRAAFYRGQVFIFQFPVNDNSSFDIKATVRGQQMGEYFGAALAVTDFDGDGLDDLLVGSPLYGEKEAYDCGAVYAYRNEDIWKGQVSDVITGSAVSGARFGLAIGALADIDLDGYKDVAIGAPYEENGVVYIYRGGINGLTFSQRISALLINPSLKAFGISLSRALDIDGNYYPDLAVGAYDSGHAVVLKASTVAKLLVRLERNFKRVDNGTKLLFEVCLHYEGLHIPSNLDINLLLKVDEIHQRALQTNHTSVVPLQADVETCKTQIVALKPMELWSRSSQFSVLPITVTAFLPPECINCPVISQDSNHTDSMKIQVVDTCGKDECTPVWRVIAHFVNVQDPLVLGSVDTALLRVAVGNDGDNAHIMSVVIHLPHDMRLRSVPALCDHMGASNWTCLQGSRINTHEERTFEMSLDLQNLNRSFVEVNVTVRGFDTVNETRTAATLRVVRIALVDIRRRASPPMAVLSPPSPQRPPTLSLTHGYEVFCAGYTEIPLVRLTAVVPHKVLIAGVWHTIAVPYFKSSLGDEQVNCSLINERKRRGVEEVSLTCGGIENKVECLTAVCEAGPLKPRHLNLYVSIKFDLNLTVADLMLDKLNLLFINSSATAEVVGDSEAKIVTRGLGTKIAGPVPTKEDPLLPLYIAFAVAAALGLLALLTVALWKCGFFKRVQPSAEEMKLGEGDAAAESDAIASSSED